jgi:hypothetical protein
MLPPSARFLDDVYKWADRTSEIPYNPKEEEFILYGTIFLELEAVPGKDDWIHFVNIKSAAPGQGVGNQVLAELLTMLDAHKLVLVGKPKPMGTKITPAKQLRKWYRKFGCKPINPDNENGVWIRPPRGICADQIDVSMNPQAHAMVVQGLGTYEYSKRQKFWGLLGATALAGLIWRSRNLL